LNKKEKVKNFDVKFVVSYYDRLQ